MVSDKSSTRMLQWARPPVVFTRLPTHVGTPAEAVEALEKAQPTKTTQQRGAQVYLHASALASEPESVRAAVARYTPKKDLAGIVAWLLDNASALVCAELLSRQSAGDGHLTASRTALLKMFGNASLCREVAFLLGEPSPWLIREAAEISPKVGHSILHLMCAFRPLTVDEQTHLLETWQYPTDNLDGSAKAFHANARRGLHAQPPTYNLWRSYCAISELLQSHAPPPPVDRSPLQLTYEEAHYILSGAPNFMNKTHRRIVDTLDVLLARDINQWVDFAEKYDKVGLVGALRELDVRVWACPLYCRGCTQGAHRH